MLTYSPFCVIVFIMKTQKTHWALISDILEASFAQDTDKIRNYAQLLVERLKDSGDTAAANQIQRIINAAQTPRRQNRSTPSSFSPARATLAPVDPESRSAFIDESFPFIEQAPILRHAISEEISRFIDLQKHKERFRQLDIPTPRAVLLYGPPGCGKSTTAQYIASKLELPLLVVRLDAVISSFLGTTAKNLRAVFEHAAQRPSVLFLDEFDAIAKMRDDTNEIGEIKRIVNSLIQNIDAFPELYVIAATNHEHLLDPAIWRRFDFVIHLQLPNADERLHLLRQFLIHSDVGDGDLRWVAQMTEGCSGADLEQIVVRTLQEKVLNPDVPTTHLLIREIWWRMEGRQSTLQSSIEDKATLILFLDRHSKEKIPAKTVEALTGISDSTVARIRRTKGDTVVHD